MSMTTERLPKLRRYQDAYNVLDSVETVFITAHVGPDGDTLGSMLGLKHSLGALFPHIKRIDCIIAGRMPDVFHFMPGIEEVISIDKTPEKVLKRYDLAISVDCGSVSRLGPAVQLFETATYTLNIDHHVSNDAFAQINLIETDAAATGQVIVRLLNRWQSPISPEAATCLYVALLTDTGGFRHSSTTPEVFEVASQLQRAGADVTYIYNQIYETQPFCQSQLIAHAVLKAKAHAKGRIMWTTLTLKELDHFNALDEHTEGIIDQLRCIQGVQVSAFVKEMPSGRTKISLRSNSNAIDVSALLGEHFGGGGHKKAAGASVETDLNTTTQALLNVLETVVY
jgi:phosphoesterase RecJ-like protein